jgi:hypothetical protein
VRSQRNVHRARVIKARRRCANENKHPFPWLHGRTRHLQDLRVASGTKRSTQSGVSDLISVASIPARACSDLAAVGGCEGLRCEIRGASMFSSSPPPLSYFFLSLLSFPGNKSSFRASRVYQDRRFKFIPVHIIGWRAWRRIFGGATVCDISRHRVELRISLSPFLGISVCAHISCGLPGHLGSSFNRGLNARLPSQRSDAPESRVS